MLTEIINQIRKVLEDPEMGFCEAYTRGDLYEKPSLRMVIGITLSKKNNTIM